MKRVEDLIFAETERMLAIGKCLIDPRVRASCTRKLVSYPSTLRTRTPPSGSVRYQIRLVITDSTG